MGRAFMHQLYPKKTSSTLELVNEKQTSGVRVIFIDLFSFSTVSVTFNSIVKVVPTCGDTKALGM
jgi:hypothetical protein